MSFHNLQLEKCPVRIAVAKLVLTLVRQVILQDCHCLGIVPFEPVDDGADIVGPLGGIFADHFLGLYSRRVRSRRGSL